MPIYEYECGRCGVFEISQRITEDALTKCPTCKRKVRRLISNTSFQLKGSGWYVTDYARGGKKGEGSDAKTESKSEGKSESKADSKTESKAESKTDSGSASKSDTKAATKASSTAAA